MPPSEEQLRVPLSGWSRIKRSISPARRTTRYCTSGVGSLHGNDLTERGLPASGRSPQDRIGGSGRGERPVEVGQKDQRLRPDAVHIEPFEARPEFRASPAERVESNGLAGFVCLDLLNHRVEVENVNALRTLAFENRPHFGFKEPQLTPAH